jgi:TnpA family transposase
VDRITGFTKSLIHHSVKNASKQVGEQVAIAAIMALGCNIGPRRMARKSVGKSVGVTEATLLDCVNWRFKLRNLARVNEIITSAIEALDLPNIYKISDDCIHSSSDGKKITVAVDSILANYSFKYFGKEKGVSVYSFIDDKQSLFHPTVISTTDREAIYVVDGLLHNTTPIHHIHSTDTHGYTEAIFAATHFIGVEFAPRFKRIEDQVIYSFYAKKKYADKGYRVLPSRQINIKLIEENWDDMLRFMATIKLGRTTASQLFKRLNSYSKDHPLYAALKEFGRILKSQHILTF